MGDYRRVGWQPVVHLVLWEQHRAHHHRRQFRLVPPAHEVWEQIWLQAIGHRGRAGWQPVVHRVQWGQDWAHHHAVGRVSIHTLSWVKMSSLKCVLTRMTSCYCLLYNMW